MNRKDLLRRATVLTRAQAGPLCYQKVAIQDGLTLRFREPDDCYAFLWPGAALQVRLGCGEVFTCNESQLLILSPQSLRCLDLGLCQKQSAPVMCRMFLYPADYLESFLDQISLKAFCGLHRQIVLLRDPIRQTLRQIDRESRLIEKGGHVLLLSLSTQLLVLLGREQAVQKDWGIAASHSGRWPEKLTYIARFIRQNCALPLRNRDLARRIGVHESSLCRMFRQCYGQSLQSYRQSCRMRMACQLLQREHLSVKQISRRCGYQSASQFAAAFQKMTGKKPLQYRRDVFRQHSGFRLDSAHSGM